MDNYVLPTCTKEGHLYDIGCRRCDITIKKGEKIPKTPHNTDSETYYKVLKGETLKSEGRYRDVCTDCANVSK